jgi:hypothetical protein
MVMALQGIYIQSDDSRTTETATDRYELLRPKPNVSKVDENCVLIGLRVEQVERVNCGVCDAEIKTEAGSTAGIAWESGDNTHMNRFICMQ